MNIYPNHISVAARNTFGDEFAAETVDVVNSGHAEERENEVAGIIGELRDDFLKRQRDHIRRRPMKHVYVGGFGHSPRGEDSENALGADEALKFVEGESVPIVGNEHEG